MTLLLLNAGASACQQIEKPPPDQPDLPSADTPVATEPVESKSPEAESKSPAKSTQLEWPISAEKDTDDRWLWVKKVQSEAPGGWATASFDRDRNRFDIALDGAQAFELDTERAKVDWERPVVLSINGRNSELRRRDFSRLEFVRDDHGEWIVKEPDPAKPSP